MIEIEAKFMNVVDFVLLTKEVYDEIHRGERYGYREGRVLKPLFGTFIFDIEKKSIEIAN